MLAKIMKKRYMYRIFLIFIFLSLTVYSNDCKAQLKPWTLRGCMRYLDRHINDTVKYDFRVSPFNYCFFKHGFGMGFRNGMGLWKINPLTLYFRIRGIWHPDDMSSIIKTSFYRYLNNQPIRFREQKKKYQKYWELTDEGKNSSDIHFELWGQFEVPDSIQKKEYLELFYVGRKVRGNFEVNKQIDTRAFESLQLNFIAEVVEIKENNPIFKIIKIDQIPDGYNISDYRFEKTPTIGDIINLDICLVYLIPNEK